MFRYNNSICKVKYKHNIRIMNKLSSHTQELFVIDRPSKGLLRFVDKLRERKRENLEELRNKKDFVIKIKA